MCSALCITHVPQAGAPPRPGGPLPPGSTRLKRRGPSVFPHCPNIKGSREPERLTCKVLSLFLCQNTLPPKFLERDQGWLFLPKNQKNISAYGYSC
ncbi:hypothetical protein P7_182 [Pectobacterium phage vB_PcaM_P7_Pc]|nr:hypothetical protein P7_182 [Pectobacterium phage vB_PcaM_P7_Pc]